MVLKKLKTLKAYYIFAHRKRVDFYSWKWRLFIILFAALLALFINDYLQAKYASSVVFEIREDGSLQAAEYALSDKLFNWFMTGILFGIIAHAVLNEGEFLLGLNRMIKTIEKSAGKEVGAEARRLGLSEGKTKGKRKAVKSGKK